MAYPDPILSKTKVVTRSNIPVDWTAVSIDNSVFARLNEDVASLRSCQYLRRLLALMTSPVLRSNFKIQFVISQALYYDRLRDDNGETSAIRAFAMPFIMEKFPEHKDILYEWPVARVDRFIRQLPEPTKVVADSQDGLGVERRMTPIRKRVDASSDFASGFTYDCIDVTIPLCVYSPDHREDDVADAFGFASFAKTPDNRVADVCHAASHYRFQQSGDLLLSLDHHFNQTNLARIGIKCLTPQEFLDKIDPNGDIWPPEITDE